MRYFLLIMVLLVGGMNLPAQDTETAALDTAEALVDTLAISEEEAFVPLLGDVSDGSRAVPVHIIPLYEEMGGRLLPTDHPQLPFSTKQTCSPCHTYEKITQGWHFNAADTSVDAGRPGHPWIYTDKLTGTQIPLSHRDWDGVYKPEAVGLTPFKFIQEFGRQFPGGGIGENDSSDVDPMTMLRWEVSGKLEANCLSCHDADPAHEQTAYTTQVKKQNFRWAAAATAGFAHVSGNARKMQIGYSYLDGVGPRTWIDLPPRIQYEKDAYNTQNKVFFDLSRDVPNERCYFCHSTVHKGAYDGEKWTQDEDIHLTSGMQCVDCHRNGMDHMIVRGYASEAGEKGEDTIHTLSCEGCHIGSHDSKVPLHGRLSAPEPKHTGIPTIHFEKMSCTTCHIGPWPKKETQLVQTALAHGLGNHTTIKADSVMPYLQSPVFVKGHDGKIEPHHLLYPSFWGVKIGDTITPLQIETIKPIIETVIQADTLTDSLNMAIVQSGQWPEFTEEKLIDVLETLSALDSAGTPVYISGGFVYSSNDSVISKKTDKAAQPYSWAFAHDVRPAEQSLGAGKKCADCHSVGSALVAGKLTVPTMLKFESGERKSQLSFQKQGSAFAWLFALTFYFRPLLKIVIVISVLLMAGILLLYAFKGLETIVKSN
jgi:hypothetical protein